MNEICNHLHEILPNNIDVNVCWSSSDGILLLILRPSPALTDTFVWYSYLNEKLELFCRIWRRDFIPRWTADLLTSAHRSCWWLNRCNRLEYFSFWSRRRAPQDLCEQSRNEGRMICVNSELRGWDTDISHCHQPRRVHFEALLCASGFSGFPMRLILSFFFF